MNIDEPLDRLTERHEAMTAHIELLTANVMQLKDRVDDLTAKMDNLTTNVDDLTTNIDKQRRTMGDLMGWIFDAGRARARPRHEHRIARLEAR